MAIEIALMADERIDLDGTAYDEATLVRCHNVTMAIHGSRFTRPCRAPS